MRPVLIVVGRVLAQDPPQMALIPDQGAVQKLAAASPDPAFGDRVQPEDQGLDVPAGRRPAGLAAPGSGGPAASDDVAVPAQDRVRSGRQPQPRAPGFRYHAEQVSSTAWSAQVSFGRHG